MNIPDDPDVPEIPTYFVRFLEEDFRQWSLLTNRINHISFFVSDRAVAKMDPDLLKILHRILTKSVDAHDLEMALQGSAKLQTASVDTLLLVSQRIHVNNLKP